MSRLSRVQVVRSAVGLAARLAAVVCAGAATVCWHSPAAADDAEKVVTLGEGPDSQAIVAGLTARLTAPYSEGDSVAFRGSLGHSAARSALMEAAIKRKDRDANLVARLRAALRKARADRAIIVHADKARNKNLLHIWVVDVQGSGAAEVDEDLHVAAGSSAADETVAAWSAIAGSFPAAPAAPSPPAARAAASPPASVAPSSATAVSSVSGSTSAPAPNDGAADALPAKSFHHTRAGALASVGLELMGGSRHFSYVDRLTGTLRPYDLVAAPALRLDADVYPFAQMPVPVLSGLGIQGGYSRAFAVSSRDAAGGASVETSWQAFDVGLRERILLGQSFILGVDAGYGDTSFSFEGAVTPGEQLPSVDYKYIRGGLDGRYVLGDLSIQGAFGYRQVLSTGDFGTLFPRATVGGIDASIGVAKVLADRFELSVNLEYARFFYSLLPQPGDVYVAGGALDEMAFISAGVSYLL